MCPLGTLGPHVVCAPNVFTMCPLGIWALVPSEHVRDTITAPTCEEFSVRRELQYSDIFHMTGWQNSVEGVMRSRHGGGEKEKSTPCQNTFNLVAQVTSHKRRSIKHNATAQQLAAESYAGLFRP